MGSEFEAIVISNDNGTVLVRARRHSDCEHCGACSGSSAAEVEVLDLIGVQVGQRVLVQMQKTSMVQAALVVYIMPLVIIGIGVLLGFFLSVFLAVPIYCCLLGGGGLGIMSALSLLKCYDKHVKQNNSMMPVVVRILC